MNYKTLIEVIGYVGSALVVVSMLMTSVRKLRIVNMIGSVISATYALIIHSYPVALMNMGLIVINAYNLYRLINREKKDYHLMKEKSDSNFMKYFLNFYRDDIKSLFPTFNPDHVKADVAFVIFNNSTPAGVFLGKTEKDNVIRIQLDYTTPVYRDCSVGDFLMRELGKRGVKQLIYTGNEEAHRAYLQKMGFEKKEDYYLKKF